MRHRKHVPCERFRGEGVVEKRRPLLFLAPRGDANDYVYVLDSSRPWCLTPCRPSGGSPPRRGRFGNVPCSSTAVIPRDSVRCNAQAAFPKLPLRGGEPPRRGGRGSDTQDAQPPTSCCSPARSQTRGSTPQPRHPAPAQTTPSRRLPTRRPAQCFSTPCPRSAPPCISNPEGSPDSRRPYHGNSRSASHTNPPQQPPS